MLRSFINFSRSRSINSTAAVTSAQNTVSESVSPQKGQYFDENAEAVMDINSLYKTLSAPVATPAKSTVHLDKLNIAKNFQETLASKISTLKLSTESRVDRNEKASLIHINEILELQVLSKADIREVQKKFDLITQLHLKPDITSVNLLMQAYSKAKNPDAVISHFESLPSLKLVPDDKTYSTLINALVSNGQLANAMKYYYAWLKLPITIPQSVYTSLIKGQIRNNNSLVAWKLFDYMRINVCEPDVAMFSLMIHCCAKNKEAEKALDLFTQLRLKGLQPNEITFTSLIDACSRRSDYYLESFRLLEQLILEDFTPDQRIYNTLLRSCSMHGDISRSKVIWNDMAASGIPHTSESFRALLLTYSHVLSRLEKTFLHTVKGIEDATYPHLTPAEAIIEKLDQSTTDFDGDVVKFGGGAFTQLELLKEAEQLWNFILNKSNIPMSTALVNAYLSVLIYSMDKSKHALAYETFNTVFNDQIKPDGTSYHLIIKLFKKDRDFFKEHGTKFWEQYLAWDSAQEMALDHRLGIEVDQNGQKVESSTDQEKKVDVPISSDKIIPVKGDIVALTVREKEVKREKEGRGKKIVQRNFVLMSQAYTKIGDYESAIDMISRAALFRSPNYLPPIQFKQIWSLFGAVNNAAEDGNLILAKKLIEVCPKTPLTPLNEVAKMLKGKHLTKDWWGWDALRVGKSRRVELIKEGQRNSRKR